MSHIGAADILGESPVKDISALVSPAAGEQALAVEKYEQAMTLYERVGSRTGWLRTRLRYAHFLAQQGQSQEAADIEADTRAEAAKIGAYLP